MCNRSEASEIALGVAKVKKQGDLALLETKNLDALIRYWEFQGQVANAEHKRMYHEFSRVRDKDRARAEIADLMRKDCANFQRLTGKYLDTLKVARMRTREAVPYIPFLRPTTYLREGDLVYDIDEGLAKVVAINARMTYRAREGLKPDVIYQAERMPKAVAEMNAEADVEAAAEAFEFSLYDERVFRGDEWLYLKQHRDAKYLVLSGFRDSEAAREVKEKLHTAK